MHSTLYLASRSLRRRELLRQIGVRYELLLLREDAKRGVDIDETPQVGEIPRDYALRVATTKAQKGIWVAARRASTRLAPCSRRFGVMPCHPSIFFSPNRPHH